MVPPRRSRLAQQVSYRELESEDEDEAQDESFEESDDAPPEPTTRRSRQKAPPTAGSRVTTRTRKQARKTYAEDSTEQDDDSEASYGEDMEVDSDAVTSQRPTKQSKPSRPRRQPAKSATITPRKATQKLPRPASRPLRRQPAVVPTKPKGPSQADLWFMGTPCAWTNLPFEILRDIISYASWPLFDDKGSPTRNVSWLLALRKIHPALQEASQTVLYYCPPITSTPSAHRFLSLMSQKDNRTADYNVKVKHLELEVRTTLAYSAGAELGSFDLGALVKELPLLLGIDIWTVMDSPEIRRTGYPSRAWSYPNSFFDALAEGPQRLRHFHWNTRFMAKQATVPIAMYQWMRSIHLYPSFQTLTYLKLTSFFGDSETRIDLFFPVDFSSPGKPLTAAQQNKEAIRIEKKATMQREDELLAQALGVLPNLRKLDLHMCSVVDGDWLQLLPKELTHLGIIECDRLTADDLEEFLSTHGQHMKVLVLNHNPSLNISFLTTLATSCPALEELTMDLTYYRKLAGVSGHEDPGFANLLLPEQKPTWPKTLQTISLNHLHHWGSSAAEVFFNSLIDSAERLPDLRRLLLSVSLAISWRERATMRDFWEDKFKRVFLRQAEPPNPNWWSIRTFKEWKERKVAKVVIPQSKTDSKHVIADAVEETGTEDDSEFASRKRKASEDGSAPRRLRPRKTASDEDDAPVSTLGGSLRDMVMQTLESHIQGMCDEVDVRIDNLRPREEQFHESDFLDSEPSGDEEWDEDRGDPDEDELYGRKGRRKYAW